MKVVLKKADEMEMAINLKAARYAFGFLEIAIMCYCIVERIITGVFPSPVFIFGILGVLIYNGIKIYETRRMTDVVEEDEELISENLLNRLNRFQFSQSEEGD